MLPERWKHRIRNLSGSEFRALLEAQLALAMCELDRRRRPVGTLLGAPPPDAEISVPPSADEVRRCLRSASVVAWAVTRAARYGLVRSKCLVRSLAIQRMLRRRGIESAELRIGVRVEAGQLLAHAWIELYGAVVGDSVNYVRTFEPAPNLNMVEL